MSLSYYSPWSVYNQPGRLRLQEPGASLFDIETPPIVRRAGPRRPRPVRSVGRPPIVLHRGIAGPYIPPGAGGYPTAESPTGYTTGLTEAGLTEAPEDTTVPPPTVTPPAGGEVTPPPTGVPKPEEDDEDKRLLALIDRLYPALPTAKPYEEQPVSPWMLAAAVLPALFGAPEASAAVATGMLGGRMQRRLTEEERIAKEQARTGERAEKRAAFLMPFFAAKAGERERAKLTELGIRERSRLSDERLRLDQQRERFNQTLRASQFAFDQFRHFNPSAYQQAALNLRGIDQRIRTAHNQAQEALADGRLDEARRHNRAVEDLTRQARDLTRQQIDIARRKALEPQADPTDVVNLYKFAGEQMLALQSELSFTTDPEASKGLQADIDYYRQLEQQLRPQINRIGQGRGLAAAGTGAERTYQTRHSGTLTSSQVQTMIRQALAQGKTRAQVRQALIEEDIDPSRFGF